MHEQRGLACRAIDPDDRRFTKVELTGNGHKLMPSVFPVHAARVVEAFASLNMDEVREIDRLLKKPGTQIDQP